jgi:hypothetical protein
MVVEAGAQVDTDIRDSLETVHKIDPVGVSVAGPTAISSTETVQGSIDLGLSTISRLPGLAGAADPLRILQLMPGIQTSGEISNGLYMRGLQNAHNLVELDGAHIYNPMHLLGVFSVFNDDNLSSFTLHKSYIPPRYGGRIGSVISARSRGEIPGRFEAAGEVGLIASNLALGIPLGSKSGLRLSGRLSYLDPILKLTSSPGDKMRLGYDMHDVGIGWIFEPSGKGKLSVNFYRGRDGLSIDGLYGSSGGIEWRNLAASVVLDCHLGNTRRFSQTVSFTRYDNTIDIEHSSISLAMPSMISDIGYKAIFGKNGGNISWECGVDYTWHHVRLQFPIFKNYFFENNLPTPIDTHETGSFAEVSFDISPSMKVRGGLRASVLLYGRDGRVGKVWWMPEPRFNVTVGMNELSAISLSGTIQQQYINQVVSSNTGFPTDFWMPSSLTVPPQKAYSLTLGYSRKTKDRTWEFSAELYCKILTDQMESTDGIMTNFTSTQDIYSGIVYGRGRNFGLEILLNKKYGRLSGWISYTLGWALRSFSDIEGGRWFPMAYERRHDASITAIYRIGDRWSLSSNFVFATGNAYTPVMGVYLMGEVPVNEYGTHNSSRMPPYHRLDVAATYEVHSKILPGRLTFSVYNLYARKNPIAYYAYVEMMTEDKTARLKRRASSLYSIIPSLNYSFRF